MRIEINNIGIIVDSKIEINGLTVITGKNNSGKSTVGKAVFSLLDSVSNLQNKATIDSLIYSWESVKKVKSSIEELRCLRYSVTDDDTDESYLSQYPLLDSLVNDKGFFDDIFKVEENTRKLLAELQMFSIPEVSKNSKALKVFCNRFDPNGSRETFTERLQKCLEKAVEQLNSCFNRIDNDSELVDYARESINETLNIEFSGQIQPIDGLGEKASIRIFEDKTPMFDLVIKDNAIVDEGRTIFFSSHYQNVFLVDDPFIMDDLFDNEKQSFDSVYDETKSVLDKSRVVNHEIKLKRVLTSKLDQTLYGKIALSESIAPILKALDEIIPGSYDIDSNSSYYVNKGKKLKIENLATGSKFFSIIKLLIQLGRVNENTLLILDEPESHLHPDWQLKIAEVIALLVKKNGAKILLTTHSSSLVLALDAYMRKYCITEKANFYMTDYLPTGRVQYKNLNTDISPIYDDFLTSLVVAKKLRDDFMNNTLGDVYGK